MNIGIFIYDQAEVLDFSGPFEVFSTAKRLAENDWNIFLVSQGSEIVQARGGFPVQAHYHFDDHPEIDVLVVVGGIHTEVQHNPDVIEWIKKIASNTKIIASVCTGAFLLAEAGLLEGLTVTTHWEDQDALAEQYPELTVVGQKRWVKQGNIFTSGGISAGIDMSLSLVSELDSLALANKTAHQMEYRWNMTI